MIADGLKLTTYFGERERTGDQFLAETLMDIYARHELRTSLVMRGIEGFGAKHHLHTDRLLSLSEDLPLVSVGVDTRERVEGALSDVRRLQFEGLATLEPAGLVTDTGALNQVDLDAATKLTIYVGRQERAAGRPAYEAVVDLVHRHDASAATVLLGLDGTAHGVRHRARFLGRNAGVPLMIIVIAQATTMAGVLPQLALVLPRPLVTVEQVTLCKRGGRRLAEPPVVPAGDPVIRQKLTVHANEQARHAGRPLHHELVRALRAAGAAGTTSLRAIWGFDAGERPHGDSFWQLRRHVPVVTVIVDEPQRIRSWFSIVDDLTDEAGLVTCETVRVEGLEPPRPKATRT